MNLFNERNAEEVIMKNINVVVKQELFDILGVKVGQLNCYINKDNDFRFCGSVSAEEQMPEGYTLFFKANLCGEEGRVLYVLKEYFGFDFELVNYDAFSMYCADLTRFFDIDMLHYVELYPKVTREKDKE